MNEYDLEKIFEDVDGCILNLLPWKYPLSNGLELQVFVVGDDFGVETCVVKLGTSKSPGKYDSNDEYVPVEILIEDFESVKQLLIDRLNDFVATVIEIRDKVVNIQHG
jgi:hypothetical protein